MRVEHQRRVAADRRRRQVGRRRRRSAGRRPATARSPATTPSDDHARCRRTAIAARAVAARITPPAASRPARSGRPVVPRRRGRGRGRTVELAGADDGAALGGQPLGERPVVVDREPQVEAAGRQRRSARPVQAPRIVGHPLAAGGGSGRAARRRGRRRRGRRRRRPGPARAPSSRRACAPPGGSARARGRRRRSRPGAPARFERLDSECTATTPVEAVLEDRCGPGPSHVNST